MKQWNSNGGTVWGHSGTVWWNSKTVMVEQCGGTVEHRWNSVINSGTVLVEQCGGTVEQ